MAYSLYKTADGSYTLFNESREEHYHSYAGAYQEAKIKYFDACRIAEKTHKNQIVTIFEVGFGLGYNLLPILEFHLLNPSFKIVYISTENDDALLKFLLKNLPTLYPKKFHSIFTSLLETKKYVSAQLQIKIHLGDARQSVQRIEGNSVDAIYHDPFSPYKNTECWTEHFFKHEFRILKADGIFSTYTMSTPVRAGLRKAGFELWEGVGDESKSTGTIASKSVLAHLTRLKQPMYDKLFTSPDRFAFEDPKLELDHLTIKTNRLQLKNEFLNKKK
jgi:tRNA U34 5-methylaminomethyl-2-thiouridine-forming methyltransferase MnmC